jgi:predicted DNA binding CopG/RHH family protein
MKLVESEELIKDFI